MRVYCSGPLFCPEEIAAMTAIARVLEEAGHETFLPHRDGVERLVMGLVDSPLSVDLLGARAWIDRAIFAVDVFQIVERCDALVVSLNGRVPDEGAAVEAGIAFAIGKPVVLYKNDARSAFAGRDNSMLVGLSPRPAVRELSRLPAAVAEAHAARARTAVEHAPSLTTIARRGGRLFRLLEALPRRAREPELLRALMAQAGEERDD